MKSNFQKIAVLCTCTGLLCSCGQSDNKQEHHKEFMAQRKFLVGKF